MSNLNIETLPEPGDRFVLQDVIGIGIWAKVHSAQDTQSNNKLVAIKIQRYHDEQIDYINEEFRILRDHSNHPNLPDFYGVYHKPQSDGGPDEIWFVLEYCSGGSAIDLINRLHSINKKMSEEHISFILRETARALVYLHKNHLIHRDVRGNNILLTTEGEIKLCDFGLAADIKTTLGKRNTCIGSPCWMAPEMFTQGKPKRHRVIHDEEEYADEDEETEDTFGNYGSRIDVWALGITAIELGDGVAPFLDMHPTRTMFQILRNPPPTLYRPANWSQNFNDLISECLEKNYENRPFMVEILEHPFFTELTGSSGNDHHLSLEIKHLINQVPQKQSSSAKIPNEVSVIKGYIKKFEVDPEKMYVEDLAALEKINEETIVEELRNRMRKGFSYTFVGDVLVSINSNDLPKELPKSLHRKYVCKSRSENVPHILSVADSAYQDMLHHEEPQHIIFAGESYAGKTTNMRHLLRHLYILGEGNKGISERVENATKAVHSLVNAGTPLNPDSTRCAMQTQITFGQTGKLSGVIFWIYLLEKLRVSTTDMNQANFHIFYLFYDAMVATNELEKYSLESGRSYRYLRIPEERPNSKLAYVRDDPDGNAQRFADFEQQLRNLDFSDQQLEIIRNMLAAILTLGNVRYMEDGKFAAVENNDVSQKVAKLLMVDDKKFQWSLENYCIIQSGTAERRKHTGDEARDARDVLAGTIYCRLVDWIINTINQKLAFGRAIFGDTHMITLTDMFGFECFHRNRTEQLMINSLNEQIQYHYNQRMFVWEMMDQEQEDVPVTSLHYYDNKLAVDQLMSKPHGLFYLIDEATRDRHAHEFITDSINAKKVTHIQRVIGHEFSIAHYTGKLTYDARDLADKNRDFLPPEMVETMRTSSDNIVKLMFTNKLSNTGNLTMAYEEQQQPPTEKPTKKSKWGAALVAEKSKGKKLNTLSRGQYSQVHKMRTLSSVYRATSLEILKSLSIGANSGNTHFVRCIRGDLEFVPRGFKTEMVHQQVRALAICDTAIARQRGYPQRVSFQEFIRRYQFLAFDFDENVEMTKDNCRLLLIRLKMEGWLIGKSKVFLKYYNVEYLSRLYETQVKKIVKVQSMMRAFLAKRNVASKLLKFRQDSVDAANVVKQQSTDEAAITIQKAFRGFKVRQKYGPLINKNTGQIDIETSKFIKQYAKRWKEKSIFQVLLHYRAARYQDLVNLSQQIHLFNQRVLFTIKSNNNCMLLDKIDPKQTNPALLGPIPMTVHKLPFRLDDIPFFDSNYFSDPIIANYHGFGISPAGGLGGDDDSDEAWDAPLRRRNANTTSAKITVSTQMNGGYDQYSQTEIEGVHHEFYNINESYSRDPSVQFNPLVKRRYSNIDEPIYENVTIDKTKNQRITKSNQVCKKRAPPSPPPPSPPSSSLSKPVIRKNSYGKKKAPTAPPILPQQYEQQASTTATPYSKLNPVKEMQLIGRNKSTEDEDDPPFNFQGILRKTKHQRASMKRYPIGGNEGEANTDNTEHAGNNNNNNIQVRIHSKTPEPIISFTNNSSTSLVYQKNNKKSPAPSRPQSSYSCYYNGMDENRNTNEENAMDALATPIPRQRKMSIPNWIDGGGCSGGEGNNESIDSIGVYVNEEIHPGVMLEGYAVEI